MFSEAPASPQSSGPLEGVKVIDLSTTFLGPYCTLLMAQMGATVIKVEAPQGDVVRTVGPSRHDTMSSVHMTVNAEKQSIVVNLQTSQGQSVLESLCSDADVLVHNMRPGAAERLRLTRKRFAEVNAGLIVASASGYGSASTDRDRPAYDDIIQARSGLAHLQGLRHGDPNYISTIIADKSCGLMLLSALLAALYRRERTGEGESVHVPMYESMASFVLLEHLYGEAFRPAMGPPGYERVTSHLRRPYRTKDGYIAAMVYTDTHWRAFFREIGKPELADSQKFRHMSDRNSNIEELYTMLEEVLSHRTTAEWLEVFERIDCPVTDVRSLEDLIQDSYLQQIGIVTTYDHHSEGQVRGVGLPVEFEGYSRSAAPRGAPQLGEQTETVLRAHGYSAAEINELMETGAVG